MKTTSYPRCFLSNDRRCSLCRRVASRMASALNSHNEAARVISENTMAISPSGARTPPPPPAAAAAPADAEPCPARSSSFPADAPFDRVSRIDFFGKRNEMECIGRTTTAGGSRAAVAVVGGQGPR